MTLPIYYFSGTGNSLSVAEKLAGLLNGTTIGIASVTEKSIDCKDQVVGVVFPVYMYRPPRLVAAFLKRLANPKYLFLVAVNGGDPGDALAFSENLLKGKGVRMAAGFEVKLPDNYVPFGGPPSEEVQAELFRDAEERLAVIKRVVTSMETHRERIPSWFKTRIYPGLWYALGYWAIPGSDKRYWLNDNCTACKICERVCPVNNIKLVDDKPTWQNHCEQCMACLQWCEEEAIEFGKKSQGVKRYQNPTVKRKQIIAQKKPQAPA